MRNLILTLFLLIGLTSFAQNKLQYDPSLEPILEEYLEEAQERGFFLRFYIMERIDFIGYYKEDIEGNNGFTSSDYRSIVVSKNLKDNPIALKMTIFHELGHALTKSDSHVCYYCQDIMAEYNIEELEDEYSKNWELMLDRYFDWLNKNAK